MSKNEGNSEEEEKKEGNQWLTPAIYNFGG
jgi:hypothetical protein